MKVGYSMLFIVISLIILYTFIFFMPKRISKLEMYTNSLFAVLFATLTDLYLDVKYHLYWYFGREVDWIWLIVLLGGKPAVTIIYLNFFPRAGPALKKAAYIAGWTVFLTAFEYGAVEIGEFLHYGKWNLLYSFILYPFIILILYWNFLVIRKLLNIAKEETRQQGES